jgi:alpha-1,2-mannosyltransferase
LTAETSPPRLSRRRALLWLGAVAVALALAIPQGLHQHIGDDFAVFWQAGRNFATGAPLYHGYLPGARPLKYPPFAALVFTPLALFSLPVAGVLVSLLNLGLWVAAVRLTRDIIALSFPDRTRSGVPLALGVLLSAQFFLDNFHHVQMNGIIFVLVLLGVRAFLLGRDGRAAAAIVAATAIKITPVFFALWLVIRGRRGTALAAIAMALACVVVPLVLRGPDRGAAELVEYYHTFLEGHQHGDIASYTAGQNLAGLVNRMTLPPAAGASVSYRYLPASDRMAQVLYRVAWVAIFLMFLLELIALRVRRASVSAFEIALVFLTALLLSPITFTTHLVPLLFIFAVALAIPTDAVRGPARLLALVTCLGMAVSGLSGRDLVGGAVYRSVGGYSVHAWTMLLLLLVMATLAGRGLRRAPGTVPPSPTT